MPNTEHPNPTRRHSKGAATAPTAAAGKQGAPKKLPGRRMSRQDLSRHEREVQTTQRIIISMAAVGLLLVAVLAFGWIREFVVKGAEPVATVAGRAISLDAYARRLDLNRKSTEQQLQTMQFQLQANASGGEALANLFRQQIQQLQFSLLLMPDQTLDQVIDAELVRQEAERRGITVSPDEVNAEIKKQFGDQPTPVPAPSPEPSPLAEGQPSPTPQPSPTEGPTPTPVPTADAEVRLGTVLENYGISREDFVALTEAQLRYQKLQTAMGAEMATTEEQVRARHILVDEEEKAKEILDKLKGGASFEELAQAESKDTSNKEKGGDLGWFGRGRMVPEFDTAAFSLEPKKLSDPVKTSFGWHIIEVLEKDANRPLEEAALTSKKNAAITDWLGKVRTGPEVQRSLTEEQKAWVYRKIRWQPPSR